MKISSGLYYIFCLYIFIVFLGISDIDLLHDKRGVELKYFNVFISIRWFFLASSFLIAFGYKKSIDENLNLNLDKNRKFKVKRESFNGDVYILLLLVFPLLLIWIINFRTADYQDNLLYISSLIFSIYCSWIFLKIFKKFIVGWRSVFIEIIMYVVIIRSLVSIDVIFVDNKYSPTLYFYKKYYELIVDENEEDIFWFIPHLHVDRGDLLWRASNEKEIESLQEHYGVISGVGDRRIGLDLRGRKLKYLQIPHQILPRVWAHNADLSAANLQFSKLVGGNYINTNFESAKLGFADFSGSIINGVTFEKVELKATRFWASSFDNVDFKNVYIDNVDFLGAYFYGVVFDDYVIRESNFNFTKLYEVKFLSGLIKTDSIYYSAKKNVVWNSADFIQDNYDYAYEIFSDVFCNGIVDISKKFSIVNMQRHDILMGDYYKFIKYLDEDKYGNCKNIRNIYDKYYELNMS